jgi:Tfp pilus assembly protein PilF
MKRRAIVFFGVTAAAILAAALLFHPRAGGADEPFVPKSDGEVLERLVTGATDPRARELAALRRAVAADPQNLENAVALARKDIEESRARSDPRYLGYAQAALSPWWQEPSPPPAVLVLRATIRQSLHDFDAALADLDKVTAIAPNDAQAWITRSVVLTVLGRYDEARRSCAPLARLTSDLVVAVCEASIDAVTGSARAAYDRLDAALAAAPGVSPPERAWGISTLGEIAVRLGRDADAERHFVEALAIDPNDGYVLGAYADLLLDLGRASDAARLVASRTENDGLLLRLAMAETAMKSPAAEAHVELLRARFEASHLRGDSVHRREESRFELTLRGDARAALTLASANWNVQREPWDVRILLESALAAHDPAAAAPALAFIDRYHLEDPRIAAAAAALREKATPKP